MPSDKQVVAFKIGARARKMANEDCLIEGYEILYTGIREASNSGDSEMESLMRAELAKYDKKFSAE